MSRLSAWMVSTLLMLVLLAPAAPIAAAEPSDRDSRIVHTEKGAVRGIEVDRVDKFLGIPFAAPPVGDLRWRPPAPAVAWTGIRDATTLSNRCPQPANSNGPRSETEDCLVLNVYRPHGLDAHDRRPVLVFIHGGGYTTGSGNQHDGSLFVTTDGLVVVSFNYRPGNFGFRALPGLTAESADASSGNYGLLDQQAALRWVQRNIEAFGGDPRRVSIAGESAGGWAVCSNLASPTARGLFHGAVIQSGSCASQPLATGEAAGTALEGQLGCADLACLRALPASKLVDATPGASFVNVGGRVLPEAPADVVASGGFTRVPLIIGTNRDEGRTFSQGFAGFSEQQYVAVVNATEGANGARVLEHYPFSSFPSPYTAAYAIGAIWGPATIAAFWGHLAGRYAPPSMPAQLRVRTRALASSAGHR